MHISPVSLAGCAIRRGLLFPSYDPLSIFFLSLFVFTFCCCSSWTFLNLYSGYIHSLTHSLYFIIIHISVLDLIRVQSSVTLSDSRFFRNVKLKPISKCLILYLVAFLFLSPRPRHSEWRLWWDECRRWPAVSNVAHVNGRGQPDKGRSLLFMMHVDWPSILMTDRIYYCIGCSQPK